MKNKTILIIPLLILIIIFSSYIVNNRIRMDNVVLNNVTTTTIETIGLKEIILEKNATATSTTLKNITATIPINKEEMPPGCYSMKVAGGCFGKNTNLNFYLSPKLPECITVESSDCQCAQLWIDNSCPQDDKITIQGVPIARGNTYLLFELDGETNEVVRVAPGNGQYWGDYPIQDEEILLNMKINNEIYKISYTRTKQLCE